MQNLLFKPSVVRLIPGLRKPAEAVTAESRRDSELLDYTIQCASTGMPLLAVDCLTSLIVAGGYNFLFSIGNESGTEPFRFALAAAVLIACFGLYPGAGINRIEEFRRLILACLCGALLTISSAAWGRPDGSWISAAALVPWGVLACAAPASRWLARALLSRCDWWCQPALVFGQRDEVPAIEDRLNRNRSLGVRAAGILDGCQQQEDWTGRESMESPRDRALRPWKRCFWVAASSSLESRGDILRKAREAGIPHVLWVREREGRILPNNIRIGTREANESHLHPLRNVGLVAKRCVDLIVSLTGGLLCLPLLVAIAVSIKLSSSGPIFYGTPRLGRGGRRFQMWKFRTMVPDAEIRLQQYLLEHPEEQADFERYFKLRRDPRITPAGKWLRLLSLDELPQIWNVVCGDMSLVGPRPVDVGLGAKSTPVGASGGTGCAPALPMVAGLYDAKALEFRPGITGLWQISGRADTTQVDRMDLDCEYVEHWSLWFDLYILLCTPAVVLRMEGAR